jgi:hypothetical protein
MRRPFGFWRGLAVIAMIGFLVAGLSLGRTACAGSPECCAFSNSAAVCISGGATACGGACFGVDAAGHAGPGPAASAAHEYARIVL